MKITKNNLIIYILILISIVSLFILLLPLIAEKGKIIVVIDNKDGINVTPEEDRYIVFYNGFNFDVVTIYKNNCLNDFYLVNNSIWPNENTKRMAVKYSDTQKQTIKLFINLNPLNEINIEIKKDYTYILIKNTDEFVELIYTNNLLWFEM